MPKSRTNFLKYRNIWTKIWIGGHPGVFKRNRRSTWKYKRQWEVSLSCILWGPAISPPHKFLTSAWENADSGFLNKQVWTKMGDERQTGCWIVIIMGHSLVKILFRIVLSNMYQLCTTIQVRWLPKGYKSTFNCLHSTFGEQFLWQSSNVESTKTKRQLHNESITYRNCVFQHSKHWSHLTSLRLMQGVSRAPTNSPRDLHWFAGKVDGLNGLGIGWANTVKLVDLAKAEGVGMKRPKYE